MAKGNTYLEGPARNLMLLLRENHFIQCPMVNSVMAPANTIAYTDATY